MNTLARSLHDNAFLSLLHEGLRQLGILRLQNLHLSLGLLERRVHVL